MPGEMGVFCTGLSIEDRLESVKKQGCDLDVCDGDAFTNKESACAKESVQNEEGTVPTLAKELLNLKG